MAASLRKVTTCILRRSFCPASYKCASDPPSRPEDIHEGKVPTDDVEVPSRIGHAVGAERKELKALEAGDTDPYMFHTMTNSKGTFEEPALIPSPENKRMIGCLCHKEALVLNWMYLFKGEPKRCECGHWFQLVDSRPSGISS